MERWKFRVWPFRKQIDPYSIPSRISITESSGEPSRRASTSSSKRSLFFAVKRHVSVTPGFVSRPFAVEPLFTRDPRHIGELQILMAMMTIRGIYARYGVDYRRP